MLFWKRLAGTLLVWEACPEQARWTQVICLEGDLRKHNWEYEKNETQGERKNKKGILRRDYCHRQLGLSPLGESPSYHVDQKYSSKGWKSRIMYSLTPISQKQGVALGKVKSPASEQPCTGLEKTPRERSRNTGLETEPVTIHKNQSK